MAPPCGLGRVLADTGQVMDKKEKKKLKIEIMKNESAAVKTMKTILMGLSILTCINVLYKPFRQQLSLQGLSRFIIRRTQC